MRRFHLAMCKVGGQFQTPSNIGRVFRNDLSPLELQRHAEEVFAGGDDCGLQLKTCESRLEQLTGLRTWLASSFVVGVTNISDKSTWRKVT